MVTVLRTPGLAVVVSSALVGLACSGGDGTVDTTSSSGSSGAPVATKDGGGPTGSSSGSPPATDDCTVEPGRYTMRSVVQPGGMGPNGGECTKPPESTVEFAAGDTGAPKPTAGCTIETDEATCTTTTECESKQGGTTNSTRIVVVVEDGRPSRTHRTTIVDEDGNVISDCTYEVTYAKQ